MKIRRGFVSNSSTSSFCIYGACFEEEEFISAFDISGIGNAYDITYELKKQFKESKIEFQFGPDGDNCIYVGKEWSNIGDDETGAQFKKAIEDKIKSIPGSEKLDDISFGTFEEAWRNG